MNATTIFQQAAKGEPVELLPGHMGHALTCQSTLIRGYVDARGAFQEIWRDGNPGDAWPGRSSPGTASPAART